jgi:hypothetical protein
MNALAVMAQILFYCCSVAAQAEAAATATAATTTTTGDGEMGATA